MHLRYLPIDAERGTIYSEDGNMLSTSVPVFDIYIDFAAEGLREKTGALYQNTIHSAYAWPICLETKQPPRTKKNCSWLSQ